MCYTGRKGNVHVTCTYFLKTLSSCVVTAHVRILYIHGRMVRVKAHPSLTSAQKDELEDRLNTHISPMNAQCTQMCICNARLPGVIPPTGAKNPPCHVSLPATYMHVYARCLGIQRFLRQSLIGGDYELVNRTTRVPRGGARTLQQVLYL